MKKFLTLLAAVFFTNINAQVCFTRLDSFSVAMQSSSICHADFNNDGKIDLAPANIWGNVSVALGAGNGTFGAVTYNLANSGGTGCAVISADFNNDGNADIVTANKYNKTVSILLGAGTSTLSAATNFTLTSTPQNIISADFNNDSKLDVATVNTDSTISILLGTGAGSFSVAATVYSPSFEPTIITADFNNDGNADLATLTIYPSYVHVSLGNGNGTFASPTAHSTSSNVSISMVASDFNSDGKMDIATTNIWTNDISILLGNGTGGFAAATTFATAFYPKEIISADFNNDSKADLAVTNAGSLSIFIGNGAGSFSSPNSFVMGVNSWSTTRPLTTADFNADGRLDIAVVDSTTDLLIVFINTVAPTLSISATSTSVCNGSNVVLTASGSAGAYVWSTSAATTNTISVTPTTTTTYSVSDGTACSDTAAITLNVGTATTPNICMVTTDAASGYNYNIVYWDKTQYTNVDSFIVYRKSSLNYLRIGAVSKNALSEFIDTAFSIGGPNGGNPQYSSWVYKLAIKDTCGNISAMSPYHQTMFVQENNANFSWNAYTVEAGQTNPITGYSFLRDDNNIGAWHILVNTSGISSTDPNYSSFPNGNWRVDATGFNCTPTLRLAGGNNNASTYVNSHSNTTKPVAAGISQVKTTSTDLNIYPNPSNGYFVIETNSFINQTMQLYNANGKLLLSQSINNSAEIDGSKLSEGVYYISIIGNESVTNKKLVIVK